MNGSLQKGLRISLWVVAALWASGAAAQVVFPPVADPGGISIDGDGVVHFREVDAKSLTQARAKAKVGQSADAKVEKLAYVSLPKVFEQAKACLADGKEIPDEIRYLGGMTSLRYVFVFPEEKDLIIAGPAEPWDATAKLQPFGKKTGRPVMLLEDLVVQMRMTRERRHWGFGCAMDPPADSLEKSSKVMKEYANASRAERMKAMSQAIGPQSVTVFGVPGDSRIAFICVAADYELKRISLGIDSPVAGVGSSVDHTRQASHRVGFEVMYEPLLVSPEGNAFEIRGQRIQLTAGGLSFDPRGATDTAMRFAKNFTQKIPQLCVAVPLFADLQNIADIAVLAHLIRMDRLDHRVQWDASWVLDPKGFPVSEVPVMRSAETLVNYTNGSICAGGITFAIPPVVAREARQEDARGALPAAKQEMGRVKAERSAKETNVAITHAP